jgi:F-type H+-transporting ATPase subunit b
MRRGAGWLALFLVAASLACGAEGEPETDMMAWKWANFAILAAGIGFLLVKQAGPFFASRSVEIRKGIEEAQQIRADAETRAAAMDARLANLEVEVEAIRKSPREEAAGEGERIRQETAREITKIQSHADQEISAALKAAQANLKDYSARLAIDLARDKVRQRMTPANQETLVENFVAGLARQDNGSTL